MRPPELFGCLGEEKAARNNPRVVEKKVYQNNHGVANHEALLKNFLYAQFCGCSLLSRNAFFV
jgi:hypothetical protein